MGSLRLGIAICHEERATDLRRHLPALQVASNAIEFGRKLLSAPESLLTRLHRRIAQAKTEGLAALASAAIPEPVLPHSALPYFFFDFEHISEHRDAVLLLAQYGIKGKNHVIWNGGQRTLRRYSVPLSDERVTRFRELLGAARK